MNAWFKIAPEGTLMYEAGNTLYFQFNPGTKLSLRQKAVWAWTITKWIFTQPTPVREPPKKPTSDHSVN